MFRRIRKQFTSRQTKKQVQSPTPFTTGRGYTRPQLCFTVQYPLAIRSLFFSLRPRRPSTLRVVPGKEKNRLMKNSASLLFYGPLRPPEYRPVSAVTTESRTCEMLSPVRRCSKAPCAPYEPPLAAESTKEKLETESNARMLSTVPVRSASSRRTCNMFLGAWRRPVFYQYSRRTAGYMRLSHILVWRLWSQESCASRRRAEHDPFGGAVPGRLPEPSRAEVSEKCRL